jgi:sRNA-binding carbon storage regulator CsrA
MLVNIDAPDRTARIGIAADPSLNIIREELLPEIGEVS